MAKIDIAKMNSDAIAAYVADPNKNVGKVVADVLTLYTKTAVRLHHAACISMFHAATTGDIRPLNTFFNGLRQNDRDALRIWVGLKCTFEYENDKGEVENKKFIGFKKGAGFNIVKGTEEVRVGHFDLGTLISGNSFMDVDQAKESKVLSLADLLAMVSKLEKQVIKKADENDIELPETFKKMLADNTATAVRLGNTVGAATH